MFSVEEEDEVIITTVEDPPIDGEEHEVELKDVSELFGIANSYPEHNRSGMKKSMLTAFTPNKLNDFISITIGKDRTFVKCEHDCDESVEVSLPKEDDQVSTDVSSCSNSLRDKLEVIHEDGSGLIPHQLCHQFVCECYDPVVGVVEAESSSSHVNVISHNVKVPPTKTKLFGTLSKLMTIGGKNNKEYADCNDIINVDNIKSEELLIDDDGKTWQWPWMPEEKRGDRVEDSTDIVKEQTVEVSLPRGPVRMKSVTSDESFDDELCDVNKIDMPPHRLDFECAVNTQANVMSSVVISDDIKVKKPVEDDGIRDLLLQEEDTENGFECDLVALKDDVNALSSRVVAKKFTALMRSRRYIFPVNRTNPTHEKCVVAPTQDDDLMFGEDLCFDRAKEEDDDLSRVDGEKLVQSKEMLPVIDENRSLSPCMEQVYGSPASRHFASASSSQIFSLVKLKQLIKSSPKTKSCELKSDAKSGVSPHDVDQDEVHEDELDVLTTDNNSILDNNELLLIPTRETASPLSKDEVYFSGNDDTIVRIDDNAFLRPEIDTEPVVEESPRLADTNHSSNNRDATYKSVPLNRMKKDHLAIFKKLPIHQRLQLYRNFRSQKSGNDDSFPGGRDICCVSRQSEMSDISMTFIDEVTSNTKLLADYDATSWTMQSETEAKAETDTMLTTIVEEESVIDHGIRFVMTDDKDITPGVFSMCLCHSIESSETEDTFGLPGVSTMDTYTDSETYFSSSIHSVLSTNDALQKQTWKESMLKMVDDLVLTVDERNAVCEDSNIAPRIDDYTLTDTDDVDENTCYSKKHKVRSA
jgi:hypothetical protein